MPGRQLNLQGMFAIISVVWLLSVPIGLVRFGVDYWKYCHTAGAAHVQLSYQGLYTVLNGLLWFALFLSLFFLMEFRFRKRIGKRRQI
jgi:hypothetical protein